MIFPESPWRDLYRYLVWGPYLHATRLLPDGQELRLHRGLGALAVHAGQGERVLDNLRRAFPQRTDLDQVAAASFATHFANQYLPMSFRRIRVDNWPHYLELEGLALLDAARAAGRGVVIMHPHMGPAQLPLCVLGLLGYPLQQVGGGLVADLSAVGRWAAGVRHGLERHLAVEILDGKSFLRPVLRALMQGGVVMTTCDGTGGGLELGRRVVRPVCGHPMKIPVSPVYLALKSGAPLLTLVTVRQRGARSPYRTIIGRPVDLPRDLPLRVGLEQGADRVAEFLDGALSRYPGDWHFWDQFEPGRFLVDGDEGRTEGGEDVAVG